MTDNKILLIGRSGRGKSSLANVVTSTNKFKESGGSVSETKNIQFAQFADQANKLNYQIIDTPGIGDTKLADHQVLDIIAEAVYLVKDGVSQVFFVTDGRFDQFEMATYDLLRTIIFDSDITKHTTIVRTRFPDFRKSEKCETDLNLMTKEAQERKTNLEDNIITKEKELTNLSADSEQYKGLLTEIAKVKRELNTTNLAEIIESCQGRVVYVDNPSIEIKDARESEIKIRKNKRHKSKEILLEHLSKTCQTTPYKPKKLKELSDEIADDYFQYLKKKEELQKELERLKTKENRKIVNQVSTKVNKNDAYSTENIEKEESQIEEESNVEIISVNEIIAQLQNKREKLQKEIAEKEKVIRRKVLKHIFNNYQEINQELGGDIFLNSVIGDHNWKDIHPNFNNKELIVKWLSQGFDYQQTQEWAMALRNDFAPQIDANFCAWLRDDKQLTVEKIKRLSNPISIEQLREEYAFLLEKEMAILAKHSQQLNSKDWKDIDENFAQELYGKTYQQKWEEYDLTYQDAQEWLEVGFKLKDYLTVKWWKKQGFTPEEAQKWIKVGLKYSEYKLANYLQKEGYQPTNLNLAKARKEFAAWLDNLKENAQTYLDENYPLNKRSEITYLDIESKVLTGSLKLERFNNLIRINCYNNQLTSLDLSQCSSLIRLACSNNQLIELDLHNCSSLNILYCRDNKLTSLYLDDSSPLVEIYCYNNQLTSLNFLSSLDPIHIKIIDIRNNQFPPSDLTIFSRFTNLEVLYIGSLDQDKISQNYNRWTGSLQPFQKIKNLKDLDVNNTDLTCLEYLPKSLKKFYCEGTKFVKELKAYGQPDNDDNYINLLLSWKHSAEELAKFQSPKAELQNDYQDQQLQTKVEIPPQ